MHQSRLVEDLEPLKGDACEPFPHVRGGPKNARRLGEASPEQRVVLQAPPVECPQPREPWGRVRLDREAGWGWETASQRAQHIRKSTIEQRRGVAHRQRYWLVSNIKRLPSALRISEPPACPEIEGDVPGLQHAVQSLVPAEQRGLRPFHHAQTAQLTRGTWRTSFVIGQQSHIVTLGQTTHPLEGRPRLSDVGPVDGRCHEQQFHHRRNVEPSPQKRYSSRSGASRIMSCRDRPTRRRRRGIQQRQHH